MLISRDLLQMIEALGGADGLVYLSVPITSGLREIALMDSLQTYDREKARLLDPDRWWREVVVENERDASRLARDVRGRIQTSLVLDPASVHQVGWSQHDYNRLWLEVIEHYAKTVVATPGWAFSRGARVEVGAAAALGRSVVDVELRPLGAATLIEEAERARAVLDDRGWAPDAIDPFLPTFAVALPDISSSAQSHTFEWLVGEREYQLQKFGTQLDDQHTVEGIGPEDWWQRQLLSYLHRAGVLGLDLPVGRQAVAKFAATACGLLESVVRVHGTLPPPGVPSGDVGATRPT